jgi:hypothetical protein
MSYRNLFAPAFIAAVALAAVAGTIATAAPAEDAKTASQQEPKLPPGWTEADMRACVLAGTPGKMHEHLAKDAGVWRGKNTMWMAPGSEPMKSESSSTITPIMDGRYMKMEMTGEIPGMGPFTGFGVCGFDNVAQKFVGTWIDSQSTGIMNGVGELSSDGKTMTWKYTYNCPVTKKPVVMRQIEKVTGPNTKTLEMFGNDPKSGKEFKMMRIELTRQPGSARAER